MIFSSIEKTDKTGQTFIIRSAEKKDAEWMMKQL